MSFVGTAATDADLTSAKVKEHADGKTIRKIVFVQGKLANIVAN